MFCTAKIAKGRGENDTKLILQGYTKISNISNFMGIPVP
jgi:hypothetical protein